MRLTPLAMSSLGKSNAIEYQEHRVHGGLPSPIESTVIAKIQLGALLNAAEVRQNFHS